MKQFSDRAWKFSNCFVTLFLVLVGGSLFINAVSAPVQSRCLKKIINCVFFKKLSNQLLLKIGKAPVIISLGTLRAPPPDVIKYEGTTMCTSKKVRKLRKRAIYVQGDRQIVYTYSATNS